jgi:hypothetical protein
MAMNRLQFQPGLSPCPNSPRRSVPRRKVPPRWNSLGGPRGFVALVAVKPGIPCSGVVLIRPSNVTVAAAKPR